MNIDEQAPQEQPVEQEKTARKKTRAGEGKRKASVKKAVESGATETEAEKTPEDTPKTERRRVKKEGVSASSKGKKARNAAKKEAAAVIEGDGGDNPAPVADARPDVLETDSSSAMRDANCEEPAATGELLSDARYQAAQEPVRVSIFFDRPLPASAPMQSGKAARQDSPKDARARASFAEKKRNGKKAQAASEAGHEEIGNEAVETPESGVERAEFLETRSEADMGVAPETGRAAGKSRGCRAGRSKKNQGIEAPGAETAGVMPLPAKDGQCDGGKTANAAIQMKSVHSGADEMTAALAHRPTDAIMPVDADAPQAGEPQAAESRMPEGGLAAGVLKQSLEPESVHAGDAEAASPITVEHSGQGKTLAPTTMEELPQMLRDAAARAGWKTLMPVQQHALPYGLAGRDLMVQSRTGSGKTGAFLLPLLARLEPAEATCQALVLVPTRELALQVDHEARVLFEGTGLVSAAVYGGVGYARQMEQLRKGAHLVVGTPGRVLDHLLKRVLNLDSLRALVFDESDRMLSIGFYPDMKEIQRYLPKRPIPTQLFSATYPPHVLRLSGEFLRDPHMLSLSQNQVHVAQIDHMSCECATMEKDRVLVRLIEVENPSSAIIFCNTKANVHYVTGVLQGFGYNADELSSDLSQSKREEVLGRLRKGGIRFLVATDVAARGIDIPELSHVFLYEPPEDHESYIHRAGRTGRAGAAGTVISIVDVMERLELQRIARHYKIEIRQMPAPTDDDVSDAVGARMMIMLEARYRTLTGLQRERAKRLAPLVRSMAADEESLNLLGMLLDSSYREPASLPVSAPSSSALAGVRADTPSPSQKSSRRRRKRKPLKTVPTAE